MQCSNCGAEVSPGATFCAACGATLPAAGGPTPSPLPTASPVSPPPARPQLRVGEAVSSSLRLAFSNFGTFFATQGVFILASAAIGLVFSLVFLGPGLAPVLAAAAREDFAAVVRALVPVLSLALVSGLVTFVISMMGAAVGLVVAEGLGRGQKLTLGEAWDAARPRLGNFVLTSLLIAAAIVGVFLAGTALIFLIIPIFVAMVLAVYLAVRWVVAAPVSMFETRSPTENLKRASELTAGSRGAIFGAIVVFILIAAIPAAIVGAITSPATPQPAEGATMEEIIEAATPTRGALVVQAIVNAIFSLIGGFVGSAFLLHAYRTLAGAPSAGASPAR